MLLATQNIDDLHCREARLVKNSVDEIEGKKKREPLENVAFTPLVYEIHGNVNYMHCSEEIKCFHSRTFFPVPSQDTV